MKRLLLVALLAMSPSVFAIDMVEVIPFVSPSLFPYTPVLNCHPGKPPVNAVMVQAEEFWALMCPSTKAGQKALPNAARQTASLLGEAIVQLPESEKLGAETAYLLGRIWLLSGSNAEAITSFMEAMVSDPRNPAYATALGVTFDRQFKILSADGQRQEMGLQVANQLSGRLMDIQSPTPDDYLMIGRVYYMCEVTASAEAILATGLVQFPNSPKLALAQALVALRMNNPNYALTLLRKSAGLPAEYEATQRYLAGVAAWMNGKLDVALQSLNEALRLNPKLGEARRLIKKMGRPL